GNGLGSILPVINFTFDFTYFNLVIADSHARPNTFRASTPLAIRGTLTVSGGTLLCYGGTFATAGLSLSGTGVFIAPPALNDSGDWTVTGGTFNANGGTVDFTGAGPQTLSSGGQPFYNFTHSGAGTLGLTGK